MAAHATRVEPSYAQVLERIVCPACHGSVHVEDATLVCGDCRAEYGCGHGVLDLRPTGSCSKEEEIAWTEHWSSDKQETAAQRFFSIYRKTVFARTVRYFTSEYFAQSGVFVEAGSGTSETSHMIDKRGGARVLVAMDLIRPVLDQCHPVMDVRVCGDIFRMPFASNSVEGIWNVGVMEHFTHPQIDSIMAEFHRTLKPGGCLVLLWPAIFSVPQRILRTIEWVAHRTGRAKTFRFHPDEISQIRSIRQGREVLTRNGFRPVRIDPGLRSLMAFETIVGEKS